MTHQELFDAARKVRDDLGLTGTVGAGRIMYEFDHMPKGSNEQSTWTVSFQWGESGRGNIVQGMSRSVANAFAEYRREMHARFAPKPEPSEDLVATNQERPAR